MFWSDPVSRLSMQITRSPTSSRYSQRCEPTNPAPPVTTEVRTTLYLASPLPAPQRAIRLVGPIPNRPRDPLTGAPAMATLQVGLRSEGEQSFWSLSSGRASSHASTLDQRDRP